MPTWSTRLWCWRESYGGLKESGWGREYGEEGLQAYLEHKTVVLA